MGEMVRRKSLMWQDPNAPWLIPTALNRFCQRALDGAGYTAGVILVIAVTLALGRAVQMVLG